MGSTGEIKIYKLHLQGINSEVKSQIKKNQLKAT